jgi:hypothetical protein
MRVRAPHLTVVAVNPRPRLQDDRMKTDGLKGCYEKTGGLFYFARMCSKIRLHAAGELPADLHGYLGRIRRRGPVRYLEVDYEA